MFEAALAASAANEAVFAEPIPKVKGRTLHVDGDYMAYYHGAPQVDAGTARQNALSFIQKAQDATGSEKVVVHLTSPNSHKGERYLVATVKAYQSNRNKGSKPVNYEYLRDWLSGYSGDDFTPKNWVSREADDGMAACAHYAARKGTLDAILTADKDMRMFPGLHLCWKDHSIITEVPKDAYEVWGQDGKLYGTKWFFMQMLHGDTADTIPGLEFAFLHVVKTDQERMVKVGPANADKIVAGIQSPDALAAHIIATYRRSYRGTGDGDDRFCEQAALLWMRHDNRASVTSFAQYWGHVFDDRMWEAVKRLDDRVANARAELDNLQAS